MNYVGTLEFTNSNEPVIVCENLELKAGSRVLHKGETTIIWEVLDKGSLNDVWLGTPAIGGPARWDEIQAILLIKNQMKDSHLKKVNSKMWLEGQELNITFDESEETLTRELISIDCVTPCTICGSKNMDACGNRKKEN